jgi:signal peptidase I
MPRRERSSFWMHFDALFEPLTKNRRALKEARLLLREGRRVVRKYEHRLTPEVANKVRGAIDALSEVVKARDYDKLPVALNTLDELLDAHLAFARKSTAREYTESIGVAVLIALFLRAFVVEAFKIPSGSMIPTLQVGDHIFVNKFIYGVRLPFTNIKFGTDYRKPRRGEVIVFVFPKEQDKDFIKRVVAVEGDTVEMRDNQLYINGAPVPRKHVDGECRYEDYLEDLGRWEERRCEAWQETVEGQTYTTIYDKNKTPTSWPTPGPQYELQKQWQHVPKGHVLVMGDNRDNSHDSRYWGFVPFDLIKGKAMVIWWSHGEPEGFRINRLFHLVR